MAKNPHAVALGRKGGSATSESKAQAARENGKRGGRPRTKTIRLCERCGALRHSKSSTRFCSKACALADRHDTDQVARFWSKVEKTDTCWLWRSSAETKHYGQFSIGRTPYSAHRFAYELTYGPIPEGLDVCHRCDVRACVNPEHLFLGTALDNSRDMVEKGRSMRGRPGTARPCRGVNHPLHKLTEADVKQIRTEQAAGVGPSEIARRFNVTRTLIVAIVKRRTWAHVD